MFRTPASFRVKTWHVLAGLVLLCTSQRSATAQVLDSVRRDTVSIRIVDTDLRTAVALLARYVDRPVLLGASVTGGRVTLETARAVLRADVERLLRGLVESQGLQMVADTVAGLFRVEAKPEVRAAAPVMPDPSQGAGRPGGGSPLYVIRLRHARAADVAATVNALYGRASALGELGARAQTLNEQVRNSQQQAGGRPAPSGQDAAGGASFAGAGALSSDNAIIPDAGSNSLLVRGTASDYELIQAAVKALDVRPLQVLIEVLIAEVRKDRSLAYGLELDAPLTKLHDDPKYSVGGSQTGLGLGDFALRIMRTGTTNINATLRAAAARGDARILSRPILLATNNESAEILVGSQRPFIQVQRSLPTDAPSRDQVVQYRDVGTRLVVRPTISADGFVALQVTQEVNAATSETQFDAPVISTRTVQTRLVVRDSQTVVLGGLSDRQRDNSQGGVPFLSSIPYLGGLFGRSSRRTTETEFFLFLTPRIVKDDDDVERVTAPFTERAKKAEP
jgi:general secretion pathway protein D